MRQERSGERERERGIKWIRLCIIFLHRSNKYVLTLDKMVHNFLAPHPMFPLLWGHAKMRHRERGVFGPEEKGEFGFATSTTTF